MTTPIWIYDRDEILRLVLDTEGKIPFYNGWYTEQLNGEVSLEFDAPADDPDIAWIMGDGRAVIKDQDGNLVEFIIRQPEDDDSMDGPVKSVYAEGADYELIDEWLTGYTEQGVDLETALNAVLQGTRWEVGEIGEFGVQSIDFKDITVKNAVYQLTELYGGERRYRVEAEGNTITRRYIDILNRRGHITGKRFEDGKDIVSSRRQVDTTGIKTALYGRGESQVNDGPRLTFASVEWSVANGDPIDKPLGQTWIGDPEALQQWGYDQGKRHRWGLYGGQESDPGQLLLNTWNRLQEVKDAVVTYDFGVMLLQDLTGYSHEKVRLGDTTSAINRRISPAIEVEASIIEYKQKLNDETASKVKLGSFRAYYDISKRVHSLERTVHTNSGNWRHKETPAGAQKKVNTAFDQAQENINAAQERIDAANKTISEQKTYLKNYAVDVSDQAEKDAIESAKSYTDSIEIGGRNFIRNSRYMNDFSHWIDNNKAASIVMHDFIPEEPIFRITSVDASEKTMSTERFLIEPSTEYTLSGLFFDNVYVKDCDLYFLSRRKGSTSGFDFINVKRGLSFSSGGATKVVWTFTTPAEAYEGFVRIDNNGMTPDATNAASLCFTAIKLEKGNKATDWTPSPSDQVNLGEHYNGTSITHEEGFLAVRDDGLVETVLNATDGIAIQTRASTADPWEAKLYADTNGNLHLDGTLVAAKGTFAGTLQAVDGTFTGTLSGVDGTFVGDLTGGRILSNTSITVSTDLYVGDSIFIGDFGDRSTQKTIYFNDLAHISGGKYAYGDSLSLVANSISLDGKSVSLGDIASVNGGGTVPNDYPKFLLGWLGNSPNQTGMVIATDDEPDDRPFEVRTSSNGGYVGDPLSESDAKFTVFGDGRVESKGEIYTPNSEKGYCGIGVPATGSTGPAGLQGVNFRMKKTYTPSSISFQNLNFNTGPNATQITREGFSLYINGGGNSLFTFWRGYYTA